MSPLIYWGTEVLSKIPKVTQLESGGGGAELKYKQPNSTSRPPDNSALLTEKLFRYFHMTLLKDI